MNTFLPSRYLEGVRYGAVALQLWDGARDARLRDRLDVVIEREDPLEPRWARDQAPGLDSDQDGQGRFRFPKRDRVDLHALLYGGQVKNKPKKAFDVRVFDSGWRYTPRRLTLPIPAAPDPDDAGRPRLRVRRAAMYPGPAYHVVSGSTGIRGRVTRGTDPVRWVHVAIPAGANEPPRAVAHGDDKGEFLLIIPPLSMVALGAPDGTFSLPVVLSVPPPLTDDAKKLIRVDPLADIQVDPIAAAVSPDNPPLESTMPEPDPRAMGWTEPAGYTVRAPVAITFTAGRIHRERFAI